MYKIGFDLGGTKIEGIILDGQMSEIYRHRIPTGRNGYEGVVNDIARFYGEMCAEIDNAPHTVGLGTPGAISKKTGLLKNCPNIPGMNGQPFKKDLQNAIGRDIAVHNDANCFAFAEAQIGAGRGHNLVFGVIMGTGCGGGIVHNGQVIVGKQENGGEWGHSTINFNGPEDNSGKKGSIEAYISGTGLSDRYNDKFNKRLKGEEIVEAYHKGDANATEIMEDFFEYFGIAISNIITILDPDIIVLGGGLSNIKELYTKGFEKVREHAKLEELQTEIVQNMHGDSAGVYGAALIGV